MLTKWSSSNHTNLVLSQDYKFVLLWMVLSAGGLGLLI